MKKTLLALLLFSAPALAQWSPFSGGTSGAGSSSSSSVVDPSPRTIAYQPTTTVQAATADKLYLQQIKLGTGRLSQLTFTNGTTAAGSFTAGLYGPISTTTAPFTCAGAALISQSASTTQAGAAGTVMAFPFTTTPLISEGVYCLALLSSSTGNFYRQSDTKLIPQALQFQTQTYASGLPATLPGTLTNADSGSANPLLGVIFLSP